MMFKRAMCDIHIVCYRARYVYHARFSIILYCVVRTNIQYVRTLRKELYFGCAICVGIKSLVTGCFERHSRAELHDALLYEVKNVIRMQNKLRDSFPGVSLSLCNRGDRLTGFPSPEKFNSGRETPASLTNAWRTLISRSRREWRTVTCGRSFKND